MDKQDLNKIEDAIIEKYGTEEGNELFAKLLLEKELNLTEEEEHLLKIIFKLGEALMSETWGFIDVGAHIIDSNTLYELKRKLSVYKIVD